LQIIKNRIVGVTKGGEAKEEKNAVEGIILAVEAQIEDNTIDVVTGIQT
jgi:hypothetical protein